MAFEEDVAVAPDARGGVGEFDAGGVSGGFNKGFEGGAAGFVLGGDYIDG